MKKTTFLLASAALSLAATTQAAEVSTVPVGYSTWTINAGTGTARAFTALSLPLYQPTSSIDGSATGVITGVTSSTITVSGAGWTAGGLSNSAAPFCIRITSGNAEGRNLLVSTTVDNTSDTLTIDTGNSGVSDLTSLGIVGATDTFEIIECDTLATLFPIGEGGVVGASTQADADVVYLFVNGSWSRFYYDTDLGNWKKVSFFDNDASNQVILPDAGILYSRLSSDESSFTITGTVPSTKREITVNSTGVTFLGNAWPVDIRLDQTGIEGVSEWTASTVRNDADKVFILTSSGAWKRYFYDGTDWREVSFFEPESNDVIIPAGAAVLLVKNSAASSSGELVQTLPYSL